MKQKAKNQRDEVLKELKKIPKTRLDEKFHQAHDSVFKKTDCLTCANCCKTTGPLFTSTDIQRLAKLFKMKNHDFTVTYLRQDEEGDYVLKSVPCQFLQTDNKCFIYEERPLACREYPHTNRKNMQQILGLTVINAEICPAVEQIVNQILLKNKQIDL
ncbi:MAG: YkgJ family cysteine cluster protein [Crocinitomicaceae bacterium]|nr:YkgJ family cysteine cluster protein [Crocinitomicaceae bacterium]